MQYADYISTRSLLEIIQRSCNHVDSRLMDHGVRVALLTSRILSAGGFCDERTMRDIILTSMLHDIGAYKTDEISRLLQFDSENVMNHSIYGYLFMKYFSPIPQYAPAILMHHMPWTDLKDDHSMDDKMKMLSQVIHAADRLDILMDVKGMQPGEAALKLEKSAGDIFAPAVVDLVMRCDLPAAQKDLGNMGGFYSQLLSDTAFSPEEAIDYLKVIIYNIDFRSRHTVTHTITTTSISYELACLAGLPDCEADRIVCGALLHDVGKIGIPVEILEFPGKLSPQAMRVMQSHVEITEEIFGGNVDQTIADIALRHHEKLDGSGYPRGLTGKDLSTSQRIVAIADIVSALAGTRSYKEAFSKDQIISIITEMKNSGLIDSAITDLMTGHFDEIMRCTEKWTQPVLTRYRDMREECETLCAQYQCEIPMDPA